MPGDKVSFRVKSASGDNRPSADSWKKGVKKLLDVFSTFLRLLGKPVFAALSLLFTLIVKTYLLLNKSFVYTINLFFSTTKKINIVSKFKFYWKTRKIKRKKNSHWPLKNVPKVNLPRIRKRLILLFIVFSTIFAFVAFWVQLLKDLPKPGQLTTRDQIVSTKIYDRNGNLLFKIYRNQNRTLVHLNKVLIQTRQATIAIEDADFYSHPGFSIRGITRAIFKNFTKGEFAGGSTITQQVVKNTLLSPEKTFTRKIKEIILAMQVEMSFSKDQILEMYLNEVSYGGSAYGIEEASQLYFNKHAKELTLAESALLAGLPKSPTAYSPFGARPELAKARQTEVLSRMFQEGYISYPQLQEALEEEITFAPHRTDIQAPHFVMYVKQLLAEKYGDQAVEEGGLEVITSLDLNLQKTTEKIVSEEIEKIHHLHISNASALVTNPATGEILAMVGSKDYFDLQNNGNFNVTTALRQPGSSIKPVNYSYAVESKKYTASSLILDTPITYHVPGSEPYTPHNYNNTYRGSITLRAALASSLNVPAVKVLASYGVDKMVEQAKNLGITTWQNPERFGLSLTLGGGEVKMVDMNVVFGTFANYGKRVELNPILSVTNYKGKLIEKNNCTYSQGEETNKPNLFTKIAHLFIKPIYASEAFGGCGTPAIDPRAAFIITDILKDNNARTPVFGQNSQLMIPNHSEVAVKTGTTQNLRDNWTIGYTQNYVVSTWVGNNDNTPMSYVASGVTGASPVWHKIMVNLLEGQSSNPWEEPTGIVKAEICASTGTLSCSGCSAKTEYFIEGTEPKQHCTIKKEEENKQTPEGQTL